MLGLELASAPNFRTLDGIIPVPLHPSKLLKRGYNQSECFATGLSEILDVPLVRDLLKRTINGESQTRKRRNGRNSSVEGAFQIQRGKALPGHFLLVDDVITTGATLVSCAAPLLAVQGVKLSIASMAYARR
jgi:predicted amidophosphoribosyltransferase